MQNSDEEAISLEAFQIIGLYDEFDYTIPLNTETHVTAVIAPNGAGKTLCLKAIDSLFKKDWKFFRGIIFDASRYLFSDGTFIDIIRKNSNAENVDFDDNSEEEQSLYILMHHDGVTLRSLLPPGKRHPSRRYEYHLPFLQRVGPDRWLDARNRSIIRSREIEKKYSEELPGPPKEFVDREVLASIFSFLQKINCNFIETQRLIVLSQDIEEEEDEEQGFFLSHAGKAQFAIEQKADMLKSIIRSELTKYAALSQSLDRTFPQRVIRSAIEHRAVSDIAEELEYLDTLRKQYMSVGILESEHDAPVNMPSGSYDDEAINALLGVYVEDNKKKLNALAEIYEKISLFKTLMENRFGKKEIEINKADGLVVTYKGRRIPVEKLSSGEQHQLVLFFSLLFEIPSNSLILIDEPEISLHIAWQKKFIGDLIEIIKLRNFDVVLATHSPQLIGRWTDLVVELGDIYEGENAFGINKYEDPFA